MMALARLRADASLPVLQTQLNEVVQDLPQRFPEYADMVRPLLDEAGLIAVPILYRDRVVSGVQRTLWVLFGAVSVLLLIAFANLANLFLVRGDVRQRELAMRRALGAGSAHVAGHHLAETLIIALVAGVLGLLLADAAVHGIVSRGTVPLPRLHEVRLDATSALYVLGLSFVAGTGFALLQMLRRTRPLYATLQDTSRSTASVARMHGRQALVVAQVALAVMLLIGAGLMIESFLRLQRVDPGFAAGDALVFTVTLPAGQYPDRDRAALFHYELLGRAQALPGVGEAGITTTLPLSGGRLGRSHPRAGRGAADDERGRALAPRDGRRLPGARHAAPRRAAPGRRGRTGTSQRRRHQSGAGGRVLPRRGSGGTDGTGNRRGGR
jgi:putative ABC transport system permease protein